MLAAGTVVVAGAVAVGVNVTSKRNEMKESMSTAFTTETAKIERQTLANSISATGTVASAETKTVNTSLKDLEVIAVYVKEGDYVEEGTVICEFDASDYEEALAEAQHNASINAQLEALNDSGSNDSVDSAFDNLKDVSESKDEAVADYDDAAEELDDAEDDLVDAYAALQKATAKYNSIKDELKVYSTENSPVKDKETKQQVYDSAKTAAEAMQTAVDNTKKEYDTAATRYKELLAIETAYKNAQSAYSSAQSAVSKAEQTLTQAENTVEQAKDKLDSAWESYDNAVEKADEQAAKEALEDQLITESQEEKAIEQYTELIDDCVVTASMSGVITSLKVTEGNIFEGGDVYTIQDNNNFVVTSSVDEYDISSIEKGMPAYIKTDATGDTEMTGEVTYVAIAPTNTGGSMGAVSNSASYTIKVSIDEADKNLRAGMTAKLSIALEESADTLTVPYDAVTTSPDGKSTITVDADGEKKKIFVETGIETDYYTEISSDEISEGMTVYLTTPMITSRPNGDEEDNPFGGFGGMMPGGDMPSGMPDRMPSGGGNRGGGMPSGGPGGF